MTSTANDGGGGGGGVDEISDDELDQDDLGNLAVQPVEQETSGRLSNVSSVSNSSINKTGDQSKDNDQDEELSLSGLSSSDELKIRSDVEDGEINENNPNKKTNATTNSTTQQAAKDSSDSSDQENNGRRRRFRKRSESNSDRSRRSRSRSSNSDVRQISPR